MMQLVYVSSANTTFSNQELLDLLIRAREKNHSLGISGMLLYKGGNFMQALEGEEETVKKLFKTIQTDPRHHSTEVLLEEPITERSFADWSMGFRDLSDPAVLSTPGFTRFMNNPLTAETFRDDPTGCMELLNFFRQGR
ncbi:MAG: BLUF domain-containing protein [Rhodoferax sp.]|nr:BLUF domain-containing protein [Rhodoferax sp.]